MRIESLGDAALMAVLGDVADEAAADAVQKLTYALRAERFRGVLDIVPSYRTIAVHFDPAVVGAGGRERVRKWMDGCAETNAILKKARRREVTIPVCYGGNFGPDLAAMAVRLGISVREIIALHSTAKYEVRAVGFVPGFGYLAGLPAALASPRLATPRMRVVAGSVGIAGLQTGVYPLESPGGWQLIGRTPIRMFRPEKKRASVLAVGDSVRFSAMSPEEFSAWQKEASH